VKGLLARLWARARFLLTRPWLLWTLAAIFGVRDLTLAALNFDRPDTGTFWSAGRMIWISPSSLYDRSSAWLVRYHQNPLPGGIGGFISPPPVAYLFAPFGLVPRFWGVELWFLADAVLLFTGLWMIERRLDLHGGRRAFYWLLALFFPPLFAELAAGQVGGPLVFLAALSIRLYDRRPVLAGVVAGLAGSLKFYPVAMVLGAGGRRRFAYWGSAGATALLCLCLSFVPLGIARIPRYFTDVLIPTLTPQNRDCALVSVPTLVSRYVGGASWAVPSTDGRSLAWHSMPWSFPLAAQLITAFLPLLLLAATVMACRRSGYSPAYGLAMGFALGALVPGTAFPYQLLALLPAALVVASRCVSDGAWRPMLAFAAGLLFFVKAPCDVAVANLWTVGALLIFVTCIWQAPRFRAYA